MKSSLCSKVTFVVSVYCYISASFLNTCRGGIFVLKASVNLFVFFAVDKKQSLFNWRAQRSAVFLKKGKFIPTLFAILSAVAVQPVHGICIC